MQIVEELHIIYVKSGILGLNEYLKNNDVGHLKLEEIGSVLGITRERVRQIEANALKKLRHPKVGRTLKHYFDTEASDSNLRNHGGDK